MGQVFSSEEELCRAKDTIGALLYDAMWEGGAVPELGVVHPLLLTNHSPGPESRDRLQEQLQQLHSNIESRAPTYLKDLIGRLSSFSEEPRLAGLVGMLVTMVMDMIYTSRKGPRSARGESAGSSCQRLVELQDVMEEYLKRLHIHLSQRDRLIQDLVRLEAQLSLILTRLKSSLLAGDCNSRSVRHWACAAAFHCQMLEHLAALEGKEESAAVTAAWRQYREELLQIVPAYRRYKASTVCVTKCRGGLPASRDPPGELPEDGSMTGIALSDVETGRSVTVPLCALEELTAVHPDLITSDQYAEAYLHRLFSAQGPVAELENYFIKASDDCRTPAGTALGVRGESASRDGARGGRAGGGGGAGGGRAGGAGGVAGVAGRGGAAAAGGEAAAAGGVAAEQGESGGHSLKLSIVETQPLHGPSPAAWAASGATQL